ncbi:alpha/beta fold hydrolase [Sphingomonas sp. Leaf25]|uniref:alpha/beta fold hydrolase n=1 Tax=Sphingomonas sp. Leaf25 TaxID=1735692 RepID=UPI0006F2B6C3|nr:alpha/beta hydrolase [Sphingomonas sp. Leaf25]KQN00304.1 lysophospholipase [Sphingomonas sp. Leaf25]
MAAHALYRRAIPSAATITQWQAADGWAHRRFDWPAPANIAPRGVMLFQGGRGDVFEKYLEAFAHWHVRGWHIASFDWRGQGGSGRCTPAGDCGHIDRFEAYLDDLAAFWTSLPAGGPRVVIGHSMGGHLMLRALVEGRIDPAAAVLVAPMLGLRAPVGPRFGEGMARLIAAFGRRTRAAWKGNERPHTLKSRESLLTHDQARYADEVWWQEANAAYRTGPPSWGWVIDAFRSTRQLRADPALTTLRVPVQMLVAEADALVDPAAALKVAATLPDCDLLRFGPESAHEILREADPVRAEAIAAIDGFLDARAPARRTTHA